MPCRNESWVIGFSLRVALAWCDAVVVLDHASTDLSASIVLDVACEPANKGRVHLIAETNPAWDEMRHRQMMLEYARHKGATHIAIVDADEIMTANSVSWNWIEGAILHLPGYNLRGGLNRYHANGIWANRWFSVAFKDDPKLHWGGDHYHQREPRGLKLEPYRPIAQGQGGVLHLWGCSERRLVAKHALYKVTERLRFPEKKIAEIERMYSLAIKGAADQPTWGTSDTWTYADVPDAWLAPYKNLLQYLDVHATPWQEDETRRLVELHGKQHFAGLDLFGVA